MATRQAKSHDGETREQFLDRVDAQLRDEVAGGLRAVAEDVLAARDQDRAGGRRVVTEGGPRDRAGRRADAQGRLDPRRPHPRDQRRPARHPRPARRRRRRRPAGLAHRRGPRARRPRSTPPAPATTPCPTSCAWPTAASAYDAPGAKLYATPEHVHTERAMSRRRPPRRRRRDPGRGRGPLPRRSSASPGVELGVDQAAAVRGVLTSGARIETLVGPAGHRQELRRRHPRQGLVRPRAARRRAPGGCSGWPPARSPPTSSPTKASTPATSTRWLDTQDRLAQPARRSTTTATWRLRAGDLVVVDESAMTDTAALAAIHAHVDAAGAKLLLVGDHRQLAAVGAGGGDGPARPRRRPLRAHRDPPLPRGLGRAGVAAPARRRRDRAARLPPPRPPPRRRHPRRGRGLRQPRLARRHPRRAPLGARGRHQRAGRPPLRARCAPSSSASAASRSTASRSGATATTPASATSSPPAATAGSSPGTRATAAARSTARPTASPPSARTAR